MNTYNELSFNSYFLDKERLFNTYAPEIPYSFDLKPHVEIGLKTISAGHTWTIFDDRNDTPRICDTFTLGSASALAGANPLIFEYKNMIACYDPTVGLYGHARLEGSGDAQTLSICDCGFFIPQFLCTVFYFFSYYKIIRL